MGGGRARRGGEEGGCRAGRGGWPSALLRPQQKQSTLTPLSLLCLHHPGLGIPLATLDEVPSLDLAIDGADEVDPELNLVKGRGGALLREKMVELQSSQFVCIVDESKLVDGLGGSKGWDEKEGEE